MRPTSLLLVLAVVALPARAQGDAPPPPAEVKPAEVKPAEAKPAEAKPVEPPAEVKPAAPAPVEAAPAVKPADPAALPAAAPAPAPAPKSPCDDRLVCYEDDKIAIWPKLRVRTGFELVEPDPQILYVGENDGFFVDQARLGAEGVIGKLIGVKLTVDAASLLPGSAPNAALTPLVGALRDAWVSWTPSPWIAVRAGQQHMPADYEAGDVEAELPFSRKSVLSTGVRAGHGNAVTGLSPSRQVGVVVGSADDLKMNDIGIEYRLGLSNGNGQNLSGNDNKLPAAYLRVGGGYGDVVKVGVGGRFNPRTAGTLPNLYTETDAVGFADAQLKAAGVELVVEGMFRQTSLATLVPDFANPAGQESGAGLMGSVAYDVKLPQLDVLGDGWSVKPALRSSFFDPSSAFQTDQLLETTLGVRLSGPKTMPASLFVDGTVLTELGDVGSGVTTRDLSNNRVTFLFQWEL